MNWNRSSCSFGSTGWWRSTRKNDVDLQTDQLGRKLREAIKLTIRIAVIDRDILSFYVAKLAQALSKGLGTVRVSGCIDPR
jgi:hypothetical protein